MSREQSDHDTDIDKILKNTEPKLSPDAHGCAIDKVLSYTDTIIKQAVANAHRNGDEVLLVRHIENADEQIADGNRKSSLYKSTMYSIGHILIGAVATILLSSYIVDSSFSLVPLLLCGLAGLGLLVWARLK